MKKRLLIALVVVLALAATASLVWAGEGFDEYGYNYTARLFNGLFGNYDQDSDPDTAWGSATDDTPIIDCDTGVVTVYTVPVPGTHLVMKWDKRWDAHRFHGAPWEIGAWCTNHDTWSDAAGDHTAFFKIVYVGDGGNFTAWGSNPASAELYCNGLFNITVQVFE